MQQSNPYFHTIMKNITNIMAGAGVALCALLTSCSSDDAGNPSTPSYIALETNSGRILFSSNTNAKRPIGMLANMANAAVAMDWIETQNIDRNRQITVPREAVRWPHTNLLGLQVGDTISIRDALYATVLTDDSAAAATLAHACGEALSPNAPESAFISQMNKLARSLGMFTTYFKGTNGAVVSQSSARDMALLAMYVTTNQSLLAICSMPSVTVTVNGTRRVTIHNGNKLLSSSVDGIKVARSKSAGACVMATSRRSSVRRTNPSTGGQSVYAQRLVTVILGEPSSQQRYNMAARFLRDGWEEWEKWLPTNDIQDRKKFLLLPKQ